MNNAGIYLDHAATTAVDLRVLDAMLPFFSQRFGNPSSIHAAGRDARAALDWSRETLAGLLNCAASEIVLTSGATEANNLAIKGVSWWHRLYGSSDTTHLVASAIEHPSVLQTIESLAQHGVEVSLVSPDANGLLTVATVEKAIRPDTCLISVMLANNEIGTLQPVREIASLARQRAITMHTDAVQAAGALPIDVEALGVDLLTISAHKFYGPKGIGALVVRHNTPTLWQQHGGGQENTRRGGTENVPLAVGMAAALALACNEMEQRAAHATLLRDRIIESLLERIPDSRLNGDRHQRLPNNANLSFTGVDGESLLLSLDLAGVAASSGSACSTGSTEPSHVLLALGLDHETARGSLRVTVGKDNTTDEVDRAIDSIIEIVTRMRALHASSVG